MELGCVHCSAKAFICLSYTVLGSGFQSLSGVTDAEAQPTVDFLNVRRVYTSGACCRALQGGEVARFLSCPIVHQSSCSSWPLHMSYSIHKHHLFHTNYIPGPLAAGTPVPTIAAA